MKKFNKNTGSNVNTSADRDKDESAMKSSKRSNRGKTRGKNRREDRRDGSSNYRTSERTTDTGAYATPSNDPAWYKYNDIIFEDATKVSYFNQVGIPYYPSQSVLVPGTDVHVNFEGAVVPSVMAIGWTPTFGTTEAQGLGTVAANAAINIQAKSMFTALQSKVSSKISAFTASDIAVYLIAIDSILTFYAHCQRFIGLWRHYDVMNTTMPDSFIRAYNLSPANMQTVTDMPKFISDLNTFGVNIQRLLIPKDLPIFTRHQWLNSNVYMDDTTVKASYFMYVPEYLWQFSDGHAEGDIGSCANMVKVPSFTETGLDGMMEFLTSLATPLLDDQDTFQIISMLIRAMDPNSFYRLSLVPDNYVVTPVYNAEVLLQLHNADIVGVFEMNESTGHKARVEQLPTENVTYSLFCPTSIGGQLRGDKMIDMPIDNVSSDLTMVATRFKVVAAPYQATASSKRYQRLMSYGSEVINNVKIIYGFLWGWGGNQLQDFSLYTNGIPVMDGGSGTPQDDFPILAYHHVRQFAMYYKFHYAPMIYLTTDIKGGSSANGPWNPDSTPVDVFGDLTNYTTISEKALERMHRAALMGEWYIPSLISYYPAK